MVVYGNAGVVVKQKNPIFEPAALLTLGLQHLREDNKSVYWSLPLAHLQYYGYPILASRTVGQENPRLSFCWLERFCANQRARAAMVAKGWKRPEVTCCTKSAG